MYLIEFSEKGKVIGYALYTAWLYGDRGEMADFIIIEEDIYTRTVDVVTHASIKSRTPKKGVYTANYNNDTGVNVYKDISGELRGTDVIHPKVGVIKKDLKFFFNNIDVFTDHNLPGQRKILIAGEPGTGKSSLAMSIAKDYMNTHSVVFVTDIQSLYVHTKDAAELKIPTICILEDCENELTKTHASVLNFLNGVGQPTNPSGAYVLFTTNHPNHIEGRIKKRPGRIDRIFTINAVGGKYADDVAKLYLSRFLQDDYDFEPIAGVFEGFTGAQIKSLATATLQLALEIVAEMNSGFTSIGISHERGENIWGCWAEEIQFKFPKQADKYDFTIDDIINRNFLEVLIEDLKDQYKKLDEIDKGAISISKSGPLEHSSTISW
jgi:SpoVK/Ycf46/Vps4 family AAA+-type ATPase